MITSVYNQRRVAAPAVGATHDLPSLIEIKPAAAVM